MIYVLSYCKMLLDIYCDKLCCKTNGLLAFLQVELLKIGYFVRYFSKCPIFVKSNNKKKKR